MQEYSSTLDGAKGGFMKNILKNNSIIITAFVIMIVIVWYLNYTGSDKTELVSGENAGFEAVTDDDEYTSNPLTENGLELSDLLDDENALYTDDETMVSTAEDGSVELESEYADLSDEDLAALGETTVSDTGEVLVNEEISTGEEIAEDETTEEAIAEEGSDSTEVVTADETNTSTPGEAVLASTTISSSFFSSAKLTREQNRAKEKETLMEMIENEAISDEVKQEATASLLALNDIMEKENSAELLLEAKGFDGAVVSIVDDTVDVVINAPTITEEQIARIESIVKRKAGVEAENIVINPVVVVD